ncbi:uncharacterized protein LOC121389062 [Gigantopelta aegis]|uniref:uncharacterized protein LOC121389062 n=1 Tax=Gigantopelta aegis TaxID=1735272 RepID=UPI001B88CBB4|nr:uncharacterized protein LOC121389062 [Gigantopelta aegis]
MAPYPERSLYTHIYASKLALDVENRRLYYIEYMQKEISFVNIDNSQRSIVKYFYGVESPIENIQVYPLSRSLYLMDRFQLILQYYDNKTETKIPGFKRGCDAFSIDHAYQRLLWIVVSRQTLVWTGLMGEDPIEVKMSEAKLNKPQTYSWNNRIYITDHTTNYLQIYNCSGELMERLNSTSQRVHFNEFTSLLFVPEHIYRNV